jgi:hypothetical protein
MLGTLSCTSASCHGSTQPRSSGSGVSQQEFVHWLGTRSEYSEGRRDYDSRARIVKSNADPHALAAQRMREPRFQEVLRRASLQADGSLDATMYGRCARCHDPVGTSPEAELLTLTPVLSHGEREQVQAIGRGIGCESCHGGAKHWIAAHYERDISRERLAALGMVDTKNLLVRARQCAACHVGSAENDMNHDMIAAGHPPLRFELASFESLIPHKHWNDASQRLAQPDYEVQLWAAGRIAAAEAALAVLEGRAKRAAEGHRQATWPELAEANCFACHQSLEPNSARLPLAAFSFGKKGLPWQTWNVALLSSVAPRQHEQTLPSPDQAVSTRLTQLRQAMESTLTPSAADVARLAAQTRIALREKYTRLEPIDAATILAGIGTLSADVNWDELCQQTAVLVAVKRSLVDQGALTGANQDDCDGRLRRIAAALRFASNVREWPAVFSRNPPLSLAEVTRELAALREQLAAAASLSRHASKRLEASP